MSVASRMVSPPVHHVESKDIPASPFHIIEILILKLYEYRHGWNRGNPGIDCHLVVIGLVLFHLLLLPMGQQVLNGLLEMYPGLCVAWMLISSKSM